MKYTCTQGFIARNKKTYSEDDIIKEKEYKRLEADEKQFFKEVEYKSYGGYGWAGFFNNLFNK